MTETKKVTTTTEIKTAGKAKATAIESAKSASKINLVKPDKIMTT